MEHQILFEQVDGFILRDNLEDAMDLLSKHSQDFEATKLIGRLADLQKVSMQGTQSYDERTRQRNDIRGACHDCFNRLKNAHHNGLNKDSVLGNDRYTKNIGVVNDAGKIEVEIKINRDYNTYTLEDREKLLNAIGSILEIDGDIKIKQMRRGSILITIDLTLEQFKLLNSAINKGDLKDLGVIESKINYDFLANIKSGDIIDNNFLNSIRQITTNSWTQKIQSLVAEGKLEDVLSEMLRNSTYETTKTLVISLVNKISLFESNKIAGILDQNETILEYNKIRSEILLLFYSRFGEMKTQNDIIGSENIDDLFNNNKDNMRKRKDS